jgi:glycolate oxidase FAD binding subunit
MTSLDTQPLRPRDAADVAELVRANVRPLEPIGAGSKRAIGRPVDVDLLDLEALAGIIDYEAAELVLTARAATPLASIESALHAQRQRLAFEPPDLGPLLGIERRQTLGGVLAANLAGSRRVTAGAARDHFLGFQAVSGRGECFKAGGKVVKNVTGYDLPKLLAGSWGTLAVLTEVTIRVAPVAEMERTLLIPSDSPERAVAMLTVALGSAYDVSAAAFDPERGCALRLEGFGPSVEARSAALLELLGGATGSVIEAESSRRFWNEVGGAIALADWPVVFRISVPPSDAPRVVAMLEAERYLLDWGGGLIWAAFNQLDASRVRGAVRAGYATLIKAPLAERKKTAVFQPQPPALAAIAARIKAAFDPDAKLNPGRMS